MIKQQQQQQQQRQEQERQLLNFSVFIAHSGEQLDTNLILEHFHIQHQERQQQQQQQQRQLLQQEQQRDAESSITSVDQESSAAPATPPSMTILWLKQWISHMSNISLQNQILLSMNGLKLEDSQIIYPVYISPSTMTSQATLPSPSSSSTSSTSSSSLSQQNQQQQNQQLVTDQEIFVFDKATFLQMTNSNSNNSNINNDQQQQQQQQQNVNNNNNNNDENNNSNNNSNSMMDDMASIRSLLSNIVPELHESQIEIPSILTIPSSSLSLSSSSSSLSSSSASLEDGAQQQQMILLLNCTRSIHVLLKKSEHILANGQLKLQVLNQLIREQKNQARAITCSFANLNGHTSSMLSTFKSFLVKFERQEQKFNQLIRSFDSDMARLSSMELHPRLKMVSNSGGGGSGSSGGGGSGVGHVRQTLLDCVPENQLRQWVPKCQRELELFREKLNQGIDLMNMIEKSVNRENMNVPIVNFRHLGELAKQGQMTIQNERITVDTINNDYGILIDMIMKQKTTHNSSTLTSTVEVHEKNVQKMRELDHILQMLLNDCMQSKANLSRELFDRLRNISTIQHNIKRLSQKMTVYASILKSLIGKFAHIEVVHYLPGAYSLSLVEVLRRRRFMRKFASEATKSGYRLQTMREEEAMNRAHYEKYFARFLPPSVIPGLQEKIPGGQLVQHLNPSVIGSTLLDTNLPSIDSAHEIQDIDLESIREMCGGHALGQGILKMYEATLDDRQLIYQVQELSLNEADDHSFQSSSSSGGGGGGYRGSGGTTGAMFHSRSSIGRGEGDSPAPSPSSSPMLTGSGLLSSEAYHKVSQYRRELSERDERINRMSREMAQLESQLSSVTSQLATAAKMPSPRTTASAVETSNNQQELLDTIRRLKLENEELKQAVSIKEKLRHETAQACEDAIQEKHKLNETVNQYASVIKQASEILLDKSNDTPNRKVLHDIISQIDSSGVLSPANMNNFISQLSAQVKYDSL